jgi:hypothetical protein
MVAGSYRAQVRGVQGDQGLCLPGCTNELNFNRAIGIDLNNSAKITGTQQGQKSSDLLFAFENCLKIGSIRDLSRMLESRFDRPTPG